MRFESTQQFEDFLLTAKVLEVKEIPVGITDPKLLLLEKDGLRIHAIFRNIDEFKHFFESKEGLKLDFHDSCLYEYASYRLSNLLGIPRVPPVVRRSFTRDDFEHWRDLSKLGDSRTGTVQAWVEGAMTELDRVKQKKRPTDYRRWADEHQVMYLFDSLIFNDDRNQGNILIGPN